MVTTEQAGPIGGTIARVLDQWILGRPAPGHGILCSLSARASLVLALIVAVKDGAIAKRRAIGLKARRDVLLSEEECIGRAIQKILCAVDIFPLIMRFKGMNLIGIAPRPTRLECRWVLTRIGEEYLLDPAERAIEVRNFG